ncbi:MAG: hypothetical protein Q9169_008042, partial [Polycauliona sp. 2 TL-2023]
MKVSTLFIILSLHSLSLAHSARPDASDPRGTIHAAELADDNNNANTDELAKRACRYVSHGCDNGYCYKKCGSENDKGHWCWLAVRQ